jgi:hypothetical protein
MNCAEFIGILKSGQPVILRRHSKEYVRLTKDSLSLVTESGSHVCLWLAANRKFKRILRTVPKNWDLSKPITGSQRLIDRLKGVSGIRDFRELISFLRCWKEMCTVRNWSSEDNFPAFSEIAIFVYLTLIPEYWTISLEVEGKPAEEALPLIEHESVHSDNGDYDM